MFFGFLMAGVTLVSAQCVEVKNVESRKVDSKAEKVKTNSKTEKGFEFTNLNDFAVTVEAEICTVAHDHSHPGVRYFTLDAKTFVVNAKEKYFWEADSYMRLKMNARQTFTVFKAFKCQSCAQAEENAGM